MKQAKIIKGRKPRSNDNVPADELLLAETVALVNDKGITGITGVPFKLGDGKLSCYKGEKIEGCCAVGAISLLGRFEKDDSAYNVAPRVAKKYGLADFDNGSTYYGNDITDRWRDGEDHGESLGWAFRNATDPSLEA